MLNRVRDWSAGSPFGIPGVSRLNAGLALVLSAGIVLSVSGTLNATNPRGDVWACAAALLMTLPVAWRRSAPLQAIAVLAAGGLFNWLVVGSYVRCGAGLPSLFLCVFSAADRRELRPALLGGALGVLEGVAQAQSDPQLKGFTIGACVLVGLMWSAGRLVRSRQTMISALRARNDELRHQRDRTAELAVAADRAQLARDLEGALGERIGRLATDASGAREAATAEPDTVRASLTAIEEEGRRALSDMREMVGALRDEPPVEPQPRLEDVGKLLEQLGLGKRALTIEGERSRLPATIELSAFRIVERLLEPLECAPAGRVAVVLHYGPDELELRVRGRVRSQADVQPPLAAAREWVSLHAGQLESDLRSGVSTTEVRLPLVTAHA